MLAYGGTSKKKEMQTLKKTKERPQIDAAKLNPVTAQLIAQALAEQEAAAKAAKAAAELKAAKRAMTYQELQTYVPAIATTKAGEVWTGLTEAQLTAKFARFQGMCQAPFKILGYLDGEAKNSEFASHFGISWSRWESIVNASNAKTTGDIVVFSVGKHKNHYIVIRPDSSLTVTGRLGESIELGKDVTPQHVQINSNHGRAYKQARILSGMYALRFRSLEPGDYTHSTMNCWNFELDSSDAWLIYGTDGILRKAASPLVYLFGKADIMDVIR